MTTNECVSLAPGGNEVTRSATLELKHGVEAKNYEDVS